MNVTFESWWTSRFVRLPPLGHKLRRELPYRWLRIHSLPGSKRYADSEADYQEILSRQRAIAIEILRNNAGSRPHRTKRHTCRGAASEVSRLASAESRRLVAASLAKRAASTPGPPVAENESRAGSAALEKHALILVAEVDAVPRKVPRRVAAAISSIAGPRLRHLRRHRAWLTGGH